ncbi:MAG: hypothetical protein P3B98_04200 [Gemmatimonadota bacterium]|nr:hypothetical protein [Gemmatimonadota bacterium]
MLHDKGWEQDQPQGRSEYVSPKLRVLGTFQALTQTRTCAKSYNDGTSAGCNGGSAKKS